MVDRRTIHRNTINNWSKLRPFGVQPLLYVVDQERQCNHSEHLDVQYALQRGWMVRSYSNISAVSQRANHAPVLRHMFLDAERSSRLAHGVS